ncbi:MAG: hypothetical protein AAFP90_15305, partial [Planctomycetota bacterium]
TATGIRLRRQHVEALRAITGLRTLALNYCTLIDGDLSPLKTIPLQSLSLAGYEVETGDLMELPGKTLKELSLVDCDVAQQELDSFENAFPDCVVRIDTMQSDD